MDGEDVGGGGRSCDLSSVSSTSSGGIDGGNHGDVDRDGDYDGSGNFQVDGAAAMRKRLSDGEDEVVNDAQPRSARVRPRF